MNYRDIYVVVAILLVGIGLYVTYTDFDVNSNRISIAGSTTLQPIVQELATAYQNKYPEVKITVSGGDSEVGIQRVKQGSVSIGTVSRNLTAEEAEGLTQYKIGENGIAIIVNPENSINDITEKQLSDIYDGKITNWNQVGGVDHSITVISRETGSGTRIAFEDEVLKGNKLTDESNVQTATNSVLQAVAVDPFAIGYVSDSAVKEGVKVISINGVYISDQTIKDGSYPIIRPLLLIVKGTPEGAVDDFIKFILSDYGKRISTENGAVPV